MLLPLAHAASRYMGDLEPNGASQKMEDLLLPIGKEKPPERNLKAWELQSLPMVRLLHNCLMA